MTNVTNKGRYQDINTNGRL